MRLGPDVERARFGTGGIRGMMAFDHPSTIGSPQPTSPSSVETFRNTQRGWT